MPEVQRDSDIQVGFNSFTFHITPVLAWQRPQQSGKLRFRSTEQRVYQNQVGWLAKIAMKKAGVRMLEGPVALGVRVFYPFPKIHTTDHRWKTSKPDMDNIIKNIKDGLNGIAWKDDAQVVKYLDVFKQYGHHIDTEFAAVDIQWDFKV